MILFRRRLRFLAAAWILFQVTSLSTLVPRACCMMHQMHQSAAAKTADCHETAPVSHHAMAAEDGTAGPMHHSHGHMHEQAAPANATPSEECALRGTCSGPAAALLALLSTDGVLTDSIVSQNDFPSAGKAFPSTEQLIRQFASPDAPPPRA